MSLTFNGTTSDSLRVIVERYPDRPVPERIVQTIRVPGRSGVLTVSEGWDNVVQDYDVYISAEAQGLPSASAGMVAWLLSAEGYHRLEDSYNPGIYRLARLINPQDCINYFNRFGRCTLSFDCMPQRWLTSGEVATTYTADATITNPTAYAAMPLVTVTGSGDVVFSLGGFTVGITGLDGSITLDSEAQNAYDGSVNLNSIVTLADGSFPEINPGSNTLAFVSGSISSISVTPRWFEL